MPENAENGNDHRISIEDGIQLALDPNLVFLPLRGSATTPATTTADPTNDDKFDAQKTVHAGSESLTMSQPIGEQALFQNPYAIYKEMPMQEFIPLLLHQRGPGFKFADLSEKDLVEEVKKEHEKASLQAAEDSSLPDIPTADHDGDSSMELETTDKIKTDTGLGKEDVGREISRDEEEPMTQEQFVNARKEMVEHINLALNESSLALEFLSLLLSSVRESAGTASMSPFLRKTAPVGSLNSDKLPLADHTKEEIVSSEILSRGWKLRSLNESRLILKEKHSSLSGIVGKEHQYWAKISNHISNKDVLFKMRDRVNGNRLLGIKYGYEDSGSTYRHDRGIAVLRNNPELNILELVPSNTTESPDLNHTERFVRVRIFTKIASEDDYILTGESSVSKLFTSDNSGGLEDIKSQIKKLKAVAFEQELMYQMKKESSRLISYGVTIENENKIVMELPNEKFEMELVSLDDDSVANHDQDAPKINDRRAALMATTLRLLLVVMFKKNLKKRLISSTRGQLSKGAQDILLLRPILGRLRHHNYKLLLKKILRDYVLDIIEGSSITEITSDKPKRGTVKLVDNNIAKLSEEINAFGSLLKTSCSRFRVDVPARGTLFLTLESPNYCNAVVKIKVESSLSNVSFDTTFSEFKEIEEFLHFVVAEYMKDKEPVKKE